MASTELSRRVEKVVGYPPLVEMGDGQRRDFHEALLEADGFEDVRGSGRGRFSGQKGTGRSRVVRGHKSFDGFGRRVGSA